MGPSAFVYREGFFVFEHPACEPYGPAPVFLARTVSGCDTPLLSQYRRLTTWEPDDSVSLPLSRVVRRSAADEVQA
jgi:hypothetical protein